MGSRIEVPNIDDLLRRHLAGEQLQELARETGVSCAVLRDRFARLGFIRPGYRKRNLPEASIVSKYQSGVTEYSIAAEYGVARSTIHRILLANGVNPRGISETMKTRWDNASDEQRETMLAPAHAASKGRKLTSLQISRRAIGLERTKSHGTPVEFALANELTNAGFQVVTQKAAGHYNIDIALDIPPLAVEVFGGGFHNSFDHVKRFHQRVKYLFDKGWHVLIIWVDGKRFLLDTAGVKQVITIAQGLSTNPSAPRQYRVIFGNGEDSPIRKRYLNTPADIERFSTGD